jgi:hypothetical protein
MVRLHADRRLQAPADPADVVTSSWRAVRGEFPRLPGIFI